MIDTRRAHLYCKDDISKIENYDKAIADTTQTWVLHHRLELTLDGEFAHTPEELKRLGMYYDRPYFELIFLTKSEHSRLHKEGANHPLYRKHHTDETKRKMSAAHKAENHYMYGRHHSEETRKKISAAAKGKHLTEETRQKMSEAAKKRWLRNKG